jgi:mono/diheme cytochrome c family protein
MVLLAAFGLVACDRGDYAGGVERAAREAMNGWDMWETPAVQPHEKPLALPVHGTVPVTGTTGFEEAQQLAAELLPVVRTRRAALVYRRYCHHCHGANGDGRTIVGESFGVKPPDLRAAAIQSKSDRELFDHLTKGTEILIPLAPTIAPMDRLLTIEHMRTLAGAPSVPLFERRNVEPVE